MTILRDRDRERFKDYRVTHAAYSRRGELGPEGRWIVLLDSQRSPGLEGAMVVELKARDGALIRIRHAVVGD